MPSTEDWTVGRLLIWTTDYLKNQGSDSARLDAEVLLAEARNCQRIQLYTAYEDVVDETTRTRFRDLVRRRAQGMPVAYLVGHREFYSTRFHVSPAVLIPRPETEHVVIAALDILRAHYPKSQEVQIVDVGVGSGAISVCLAREWKAARILAIDSSSDALAVAQQNIEQYEVGHQVTLQEGNLLEQAPSAGCDLIVSNPPYVSEREYAELDETVRKFEPKLALVGGVKGDELTRQLVKQSIEKLKPGGWLVFETSPMLADGLHASFERSSNFDRVSVQKDLAGHARILVARRAGAST